MVGETNGPNEHEVRMATSEHKFDDLLAFVYMMVKQVVETGNQKRKDDKNTNGEVSEGRPHINMDPLPRPPTLPKPKERDPQLDSKIDDSEEKIRLMRGLSSFGTQIPSNGEEEQRRFSENTPSGGEKWRPRACPLLDEKEMIKIFVDTLKNPYFDRIVGLQLQFLVDLILVEERIEDAVRQDLASDSTSSQGAQDLNDLLGLLKGVVFVREVNGGTCGSYIKIDDGS
uniref:Uncharacterized protein n=1 Tax=Fagus sylvatica TaxID=28930 RepID=A0A2N9FQR9_FAGSY